MWLQSVAAELPITLADGAVWLSIAQGLLIGAICVLFGVWVARFVGLLGADAPAGEILGVGLASGLLVLTSWWAAIVSGGRSSFTPVAIGFALAIGLAAVRRWRPADAEPAPVAVDAADDVAAPSETGRLRHLVVAVVGGALFVTAVALLYGATMAQSPRDGVQPLEFMDEAYYAVLGADLAKTGTESLYSPSGFTDIPGLPVQTWYHWGEAWLGSIAIALLGTEPLDARHLIALPLLLLAAAALTGTLVRRMTGSRSRGPFLWGFAACLFLAPAPLIPGGHFSSWAVGLVFGITLYGLAAVAVLLSLYALAVLGRKPASWALAAFVGSAAAVILPSHIVIAVLAAVGVGSVWALRIGQSLLATRRLPVVPRVWQRAWLATILALAATVGWGVLTGHGIGTSGLSPNVPAFNASWREALAIMTVGAGAFLAIPVAWLAVHKDSRIEADTYLGTIALLVAGALIWGSQIGDFNTFHVFFGGLALIAAPITAVAVASLWLRLRMNGHVRLALALLVVCAVQVDLGVALGIGRMKSFGPGTYPPISIEMLAEINRLPADAKLAYACLPSEENAFWTARLISLAAHTSRHIVPMCFQAETFGLMSGGEHSEDLVSPLFETAPQQALYPTSTAAPDPAEVASFLKANGIDYIYKDALHPNTLVPDALPVATSGDTQILRLP